MASHMFVHVSLILIPSSPTLLFIFITDLYMIETCIMLSTIFSATIMFSGMKRFLVPELSCTFQLTLFPLMEREK